MEALVLFLKLFGVVAALILFVTAIILLVDTLHGKANESNKPD